MPPAGASAVQPPAANQTNTPSETPQALKAWWAGFKKRGKKEGSQKEPEPIQYIFGVPLADSIKYANVAISLVDGSGGKAKTYGYVPIVVAKCGVFLKEKATDVEGIFRLSGSAKRIKELQQIFDTPDRYGRGLDWTGYTVHDAANVLRRYLNNLPQPIIPLEFYERFREPIRGAFDHSGTDGNVMSKSSNFDHNKVIVAYKQLTTEIPPLNRQLLLYILDLLAVFASKHETNLMTSANLAAIFQPGVLSHPIHDMTPEAYRLSQDVLIFLIDNQDHFLFDDYGPADQKTVEENQSGSVARRPTTPGRSGLGRSASIGSTTATDGKRFSGIRRNVSTSSRNSRQSSQGPATPHSERFGGSSVNRSNTLPSRKSPALPGARFNRGIDSPNTPLTLSPIVGGIAARNLGTPSPEAREDKSLVITPAEGLGLSTETGPSSPAVVSERATVEKPSDATDQYLAPPAKTRKVTDIFSNLTSGTTKDGRQPNKLQKRRIASNASGNSSAASLVGGESSPGFPATRSTGLQTPDVGSTEHVNSIALTPEDDTTPRADDAEPKTPVVSDQGTTAFPAFASNSLEAPRTPQRPEPASHATEATLRARSGSHSHQSVHSRSSVTDMSELDPDQTEAAREEQKEKKRRWRFSTSAKKSKSPARVGGNSGADQSSSSIGSWHRSRKSMSNDANPTIDPVPSLPQTTTTISSGTDSGTKSMDKSRIPSGDKSQETEDEKDGKIGFFDKLKKKVKDARDDRRERDAEKERAKSSERDADRNGSQPTLASIANEQYSARRPSIAQQIIPEQTEPSFREDPVKDNATAGNILREDGYDQPPNESMAAAPVSTLETSASKEAAQPQATETAVTKEPSTTNPIPDAAQTTQTDTNPTHVAAAASHLEEKATASTAAAISEHKEPDTAATVEHKDSVDTAATQLEEKATASTAAAIAEQKEPVSSASPAHDSAMLPATTEPKEDSASQVTDSA